MTVPNEVMLITYGDSMGENLHQLNHILDAYFAGAVGGVHLLPFFPSSGDRGFSPMNYTTVDPRLGSWHDVDALAEKNYLMADLMINHLSCQSAEFQDYLQHHDQSDYAGMFLNWDKFWPANRPTQADVDLIYKRKDKAPYQEITFADGNQSKVWNTFSEEQIDLDVNAPQAKAMFRTAMAILPNITSTLCASTPLPTLSRSLIQMTSSWSRTSGNCWRASLQKQKNTS